MATGTGIYTPPEMLGDGTADNTKFLRGDSTWASSEVEFSPSDFLDLLVYAFQRIDFLEQALGIQYSRREPDAPEPYALIQERVLWK